MKRYLSSPFFLIALLCFFLPFFAVTCGGASGIPLGGGEDASVEVSGLELVTGQAEDELADTGDLTGGLEGFGEGFAEGLLPQPGPSPSIPEIPGSSGSAGGVDLGTAQIWAIAAAAVALLGIFLALLGGSAGGILALILGAAGAVLLFLLGSEFKDAVLGPLGSQAEGVITVENKIGFWAALGGFIVAAVTGLLRVLLPDRPGLAPPATGGGGFGSPPAGPPPSAPPPTATPPAAPPPAAPQ